MTVPAKKFPTLLVVFGVLGGALIFSCAVGAVGYIVFVHEFKEPITQADRDMLLTVEKLKPFFEVAVDPGIGKAKHVRYLDGSRELSYEYESPDDAEDHLYVSSSVNIERSVSDARTMYLSTTVGLKIGFALEGDGALQEVPKADLFQWGDESKSVLLVRAGKPVGNIFAGRKGKEVFHVMLAGLYFDKRADVDALLSPLLERIEARP